uniref:Serpin domain-containing protein n=2 Tax=Plectus sambesii TaxID=2011161 RepID=A0A914VJC2_9BILA
MASKLETAQAQFALDLLRTASKGDENCFLSPVSISVALAMTYAGAADNTKLQMNQVMFNGAKSDEEVHGSFGELVSKLSEAKNGYEMTTANKMYAQKGFAIQPNYVDKLSKHYRNSVHAVDFKSEAESARNEINGWVAETTKQRIKDLLAPDVLNSDTRLVLVNAIYFKGEWAEQFKDYQTNKATFYAASNKESKVDMMHMTERFKYSDQPDCQVLGMQYKGYELAMYVFLPKKRDGLAEVESSLTGERMLQLIEGDRRIEVEVHLPKFKLEMSFGLGETLSSLGMSDLFDCNKADLSNITGDKSLHVSAVIHKAFIEVNEEGSEAAAATAVVMMLECGMVGPDVPPPKFIADHPFLFAISDGKSLFFLGRYTGL